MGGSVSHYTAYLGHVYFNKRWTFQEIQLPLGDGQFFKKFFPAKIKGPSEERDNTSRQEFLFFEVSLCRTGILSKNCHSYQFSKSLTFSDFQNPFQSLINDMISSLFSRLGKNNFFRCISLIMATLNNSYTNSLKYY